MALAATMKQITEGIFYHQTVSNGLPSIKELNPNLYFQKRGSYPANLITVQNSQSDKETLIEPKFEWDFKRDYTQKTIAEHNIRQHSSRRDKSASDAILPKEPSASDVIIPKKPGASDIILPKKPSASDIVLPKGPSVSDVTSPKDSVIDHLRVPKPERESKSSLQFKSNESPKINASNAILQKPLSRKFLEKKPRKEQASILSPDGDNLVVVNMTSHDPLFIPIEKSITLDPGVIWTGDKKATMIDKCIYNVTEPDYSPCRYISEDGPGTCLVKSHDGFYLTGDSYATDPFECYSIFKVTVKKSIKFPDWEKPINSSLPISQLVDLIKPLLPPAPKSHLFTFRVSCPSPGKKVIAFKPIYYKIRGIFYNEDPIKHPKGQPGTFHDLHFPVLIAKGIVHAIYSVRDYPNSS